jgi:hypothetical protein
MGSLVRGLMKRIVYCNSPRLFCFFVCLSIVIFTDNELFSQYFLQLMRNMPKSIVENTSHLIIRTEVGTERVQLRMGKDGKGSNFSEIVESLAMKRSVHNIHVLNSCSSL